MASLLALVGCDDGSKAPNAPTTQASTSTAALCDGGAAASKIDGQIASISVRRENYTPGSGVLSDVLGFDVDLACDRGSAQLSLSCNGQSCAAAFRLDEAQVADLESLATGVRLCTERREASSVTPPVLESSIVQFVRSCPADGPSSFTGTPDTNVSVHRFSDWPHSESGDASYFREGHTALLLRLESLAEPHITEGCPANWRDAFFSP